MLNSNSTGFISPALRIGLLTRHTVTAGGGQDRLMDLKPVISRPCVKADVSRYLRDTPSQLVMSAINQPSIDSLSALFLRELSVSRNTISRPKLSQSELSTWVATFRKRKRAGSRSGPLPSRPPPRRGSRSGAGPSRHPPRTGGLVLGGQGELIPQISFNRNDRAFSTFWKEKIQVHPGDNRRHIPLVAVMKAMLQEAYGLAKSQVQKAALDSSFDQFISSMQDTDNAALQELNLEAKAKKVLGLLTNLRSHIFLGYGPVNQVMGSLSDLLAQSEQATLDSINQETSVQSLEVYLGRWSNDFQNKMKRSLVESDVLIEHQDIRHFDRPTLVHYYMRQFAEITACLTADNFPDLQDFKQQARALVKNLRDSYATDISGAGHNKVRYWQNQHWLDCHKNMLNLVDKPDIEGVAQVLKQVASLEYEFALLISSLLNEQGFNTTPDMFHMNNKGYLNSTSAEPIRVALMALLQEPSSVNSL